MNRFPSKPIRSDRTIERPLNKPQKPTLSSFIAPRPVVTQRLSWLTQALHQMILSAICRNPDDPILEYKDLEIVLRNQKTSPFWPAETKWNCPSVPMVPYECEHVVLKSLLPTNKKLKPKAMNREQKQLYNDRLKSILDSQ